MLYPVDIQTYYKNVIDERSIKESFSLDLISKVLDSCSLFSKTEMQKFETLQKRSNNNVSLLSDLEYKKELERLTIDLSWKSSQIEGNTYSLLETERLLKEKETACGKTKEEAVMLLNHKEAIAFIIENPDYLIPLSVPKIVDIHRLLIKEIGCRYQYKKAQSRYIRNKL